MSSKQEVKEVVIRDLRVFQKRALFFKRPGWVFNSPDKLDVIFFIILAVFIVSVCILAPYSGSPIEAEQMMASKFQWIAIIACLGAYSRHFFDTTPVERNNAMQEGRTKTIYESKNSHGLILTVVCFVIAFGIHAVLYFFMIQIFPLSIIEPRTQIITMTVTVAVAEELLFSYYLTGLFAPRGGWFVVPGVIIVFLLFHFYVYEGCLAALVYVGVMRGIYSIIYLLSRRISSVMLAHMLNNFLVAMRIF